MGKPVATKPIKPRVKKPAKSKTRVKQPPKVPEVLDAPYITSMGHQWGEWRHPSEPDGVVCVFCGCAASSKDAGFGCPKVKQVADDE
jgi:hypothetical protein